MFKKIAVLPGDGIGPEVVEAAKQVLEAIPSYTFEYTTLPFGGNAIDECDTPLPVHTLEACKKADAVILGAVGGPKWDNNPKDKRPEAGLLGLRKELGLFCNLRPVRLLDSLKESSTIKAEVIANTDILVVRELTGGMYFGKKQSQAQFASDECIYYDYEIERVVRSAFEFAKQRKNKVTSVDKANVLETSKLWRVITERVAKEYPDVFLEHMLVDNCAMQLLKQPSQFDVLVTENMFGDILSDEAAMLTGSIGMLASASIGQDYPSVYEPVHGSAPDIAGQQKANPLATILSLALMFRYSFQDEKTAQKIEKAVEGVLEKGYRTFDLLTDSSQRVLSTDQMSQEVIKQLMV